MTSLLAPPSNSILLTGGVGDTLALESFFSDAQRKSTENVYYATRSHKPIRQILESLPNYNIKRHVVIWDEFNDFFCFGNKNEVLLTLSPSMGDSDLMRRLRIACARNWRLLLDKVSDLSILTIFPSCNSIYRPYNRSSVLMHKIADISHMSLPEKFIVICPYSINDKRIKQRDFTEQDWNVVLNYMKKQSYPGVVLNIGNDPVPDSPMIINLSNKTTITESIEVLKKAVGYIGIDSALSVVAAKLFAPPMLMIKSVNDHLYKWAQVYYAPHINMPFVVKHFQGL